MTAAATDWQQQSAPTLLQTIAEAGITGMGGGGFPTAEKLAAARRWQQTANDRTVTFIANAVACEPGIDADPWLMQQASAEVLLGALIVARVLQTGTVILALGPRLASQADALQSQWLELADTTVAMQIFQADAAPAAGAERTLITAVTGATLSCDTPPACQGYVVQNVITLWAVARAVAHGEAIDRRPVTIGNETRWVALGTPVASLPEAAHCQRDGGLWSAQPLAADAVVTSRTLALHSAPPQPPAPCIGCGECAVVCPVSIDPDALHRLEARLPDEPLSVSAVRAPDSAVAALQALGIDDCVECGACNAHCPSHIDLLAGFRDSKQRSAEAQRVLQQAERAAERFERHQQRLAQRAARSDDRRAARLQRRRSWTDADPAS